MKTLKYALETGKKYLLEKKIENANLDSWYLLSHQFGLSRTDYFLDPEKIVTEDEFNQYIRLIERRGNHVPLQYIIGFQEFMGLNIKVNENVLIPRQDTETLVEEVLKVSQGKDILDVCTGSGCIIISLAMFGNIKKAVGIDISKEALAIAEDNANEYNVNVDFIQSDLFSQVEGKFDIIVSNPPYIPSKDILDLMDEVKNYEPHLALDGMEDGLSFYRKITSQVRNFLKPGGYIFYEIGYDQADEVSKMLKGVGIRSIEVIKDLTGLDRVVSGRYDPNIEMCNRRS